MLYDESEHESHLHSRQTLLLALALIAPVALGFLLLIAWAVASSGTEPPAAARATAPKASAPSTQRLRAEAKPAAPRAARPALPIPTPPVEGRWPERSPGEMPFPEMPPQATVTAPGPAIPPATSAAEATWTKHTVTEARSKAEAAVKWLLKQQKPDGSWVTDMGANRPATVAATAFCALALMASDHKHDKEVDHAANNVIGGLFKSADTFDRHNDQSNWRVAIGGLFVAEYAAAVQKKSPTQFKRLLPQLDKLVSEIVRRMEGSGGWGHTYTVKNPLNYLELEVMSNWMLATLGACKRLGVKLPAGDVEQALRFIEDCCNAGEGGVGYSPLRGQKGFGCPCRTGGAIFAFAMMGQQERPVYPMMLDYWKRTMEQSSEGHGSTGLGLLASALAAKQAGAADWQRFRERFFPMIVEHAAENGSFRTIKGRTPQAVGGDALLGAAYCTGIYTLILELDGNGLTFLGQPQKPNPRMVK